MAEAAIKSTDNRRAAGHLGIGMHSYGEQWKLAKETPERAWFHDALTFLEYAHSIGAGGVQVAIGARDADYTKRLRSRAEALGVYLESQTSLPRDENDVARFEAEARSAKDSGATVMRTAMLSGRRYVFDDYLRGERRFRPTDRGDFARKLFTGSGDRQNQALGYSHEWSGIAKVTNRSWSNITTSYEALFNLVDSRRAEAGPA